MSDNLGIPKFLAVANRQRLVLETARERLRAELGRPHATAGEVRAAVQGILTWLDGEAAHADRQAAIVDRAVPIEPVDLPPHPGVARFNSNACERSDYGGKP